MTATNKSKWYNNKVLLIILFFILPPLGIVGIFKRNPTTWKKIAYTLGGITSSLFLLFLTVGIIGMIFFPKDYYKDGNEYFHKGQYDKALENYNKVPKEDIHYTDAQNQLNQIRQISDSLAMQTQIELEAIELKKQEQFKELTSFQKHWADSIMKVYEGYIIKNTVSIDTIYFQLGIEATKGNWRHSADLNQSVIQKDYDNVVSVKFPNMDKPNTIMQLIPDEKQAIENQKIAARKERILKQFSSWDGSHRNLEKWLKNNMNDPKSFEHVETTYTDKGDYLLVYMKYRGKNSFGAKVLQTVIGTVDLNGNVLSVKH
ncbi:tetratricopeptide repeat protein [Dysgonomonas capnocytophagoides]|uniref:tetratricopeptide repeat protein n=1 Tax=Dysgonomonas capnocytophagoides TaxID=45254 RepID=UPI00333ED012